MVRSARLLGISVAAALVASLVFVAPALAGGQQSATGNVITVHKGGDIQRAVNRAEPGDTVEVDPGKYTGPVFVQTDRVHLIGAGANETWIVPPGGRTPFCGICVFGAAHHGEITNPVKGVVVKGFHIDGFRDFGLAGFASMSLNVRNVVASDNGEYGITAFVSKGAEFFSDTTWGNGEAGFYIGDSPDAQALLTNNTAHDSRFGFFIRDASYGYVHGNTAYGNCAGFLFLNTRAPGPTKRWVAENNWAHDNNRTCEADEGPAVAGLGVALVGTSHVKLVHNFIWGNQSPSKYFIGSGIVVVSGKPDGGSNPIGNVVERNKLHSNEPYDIWYDGTGKNNSFDNNRCRTSSPRSIC
jgi:parallel beta-helix repeat protein